MWYTPTTSTVHLSQSKDGRRLYQQHSKVEQLPEPQELHPSPSSGDVGMQDIVSESRVGETRSSGRNKKEQYNNSVRRSVSCLFTLPSPYIFKDRPLDTWREQYQETYLRELLRLEGRGDSIRSINCPDCRNVWDASDSERCPYRCRDCFSSDVVCRACAVRRHRRNPTHILEVCIFL